MDLTFGRRINDTIPMLRHSQPVKATKEAIAKRDALAKAAMKGYADGKRHVKEHRIRPGDKVLRRRHNRRKTDTFFEYEPWTISEVRGNTLVMRREEQQCARHVSETKKLTAAEDETRVRSRNTATTRELQDGITHEQRKKISATKKRI